MMDDLFFPSSSERSSTGWIKWNFRYQCALELPETTIEDRIRKYSKLTSINQDFIRTAERCASLIVDELFVREEERTVKTVKLPGIAGGTKYVMRGILFKLARGHFGPYDGCDEAAIKAAGNELRGANFLQSVNPPGISVALQALIDYKGFRMHASAQLPIDDKTIKVGTYNGRSADLVIEDDALLDMMRFAARRLRLSGHQIRTKKGEKRIYSAADLEGHVGKDGRGYLVDLARTFPPEAPFVATHLRVDDPSFAIGQPVLVRRHPDGAELRARIVGRADVPGDVLVREATSKGFAVRVVNKLDVAPVRGTFWKQLRPEFVKHRGVELLGDPPRRVRDGPIAATRTPTSDVEQNKADLDGEDFACYDSSLYDELVPENLERLLAEEKKNTTSSDSESDDEDKEDSGHHVRPISLSPDAYSNFSREASDCIRKCVDVRNATRRLVDELIPKLAETLRNEGTRALKGLRTITELMHRHGINARHMGLLRQLVGNETTEAVEIRDRLLEQIVTRTLKNLLKYVMRSTMEALATPSEKGLRRSIVRFLDRLSGADDVRSDSFWNRSVPAHVAQRFGSCALSDEEKMPGSLRKFFLGNVERFPRLILALLGACGICLSDQGRSQLKSFATMGGSRSFDWSLVDIAKIEPRTRYLYRVDLFSGQWQSLLAQQREARQSAPSVVVRLADEATASLGRALRTMPDDVLARNALADSLQTKAFALRRDLMTSSEDSTRREAEVQELFERARVLRTKSGLRCFRTGVSFRDDILGHIVVRSYRVSNCMHSMPKLQVDPRPVSLRYFLEHDANRKSVHFVPLAIDEEHATRSRRLLLEELYRAFQNAGESSFVRPILEPNSAPIPLNDNSTRVFKDNKSRCEWHHALALMGNMINQVVVAFAKAAELSGTSITADVGREAHIACITRLHHSLLLLARDFPEIVSEANERVRLFVVERKWSKKFTPNLGLLLVYVLLSDEWEWTDVRVRRAYFLECINRNTGWALIDCAGSLAVLETEAVCPFRLCQTFQCARASYRVLMFQNYFVKAIACRRDLVDPSISSRTEALRLRRSRVLELYNRSFGRVTSGMWEGLRNECRSILAVNTYPGLFARIGLEYSPSQMTVLLRNAVRNAYNKQYLGFFTKKYPHCDLKQFQPSRLAATEILPDIADDASATSWTQLMDSYDSFDRDRTLRLEQIETWKTALKSARMKKWRRKESARSRGHTQSHGRRGRDRSRSRRASRSAFIPRQGPSQKTRLDRTSSSSKNTRRRQRQPRPAKETPSSTAARRVSSSNMFAALEHDGSSSSDENSADETTDKNGNTSRSNTNESPASTS